MPVDTEKREKTNRAPGHVAKKKDRTLIWRILTGILLLSVIVLGALLFLAKQGMLFAPVEEIAPIETPEPTEEPVEIVRYTAWCATPLGDPLSVSAEPGETVTLPEGPAIEGYTFIGWTDSAGDRVAKNMVTLYTDGEIYQAVYAIAFRDESAGTSHAAYMSVDQDKMFRPRAALSRAEAAELIYTSLNTTVEGAGSFRDVDPSASYYKATATLKDLGVIDGSRFHPDDPVSCSEFIEMLAHFFPESTQSFSFENISETDARYGDFCLAMEKGWIDDLSILPDRDLTRAEAAHIFNSLRGRSSIAERDYAKVGTILDLSFRDPYFWDIAEAVIPHEAAPSENGELWSASSALALQQEGTFFIGTALHCIDAQGSALINESYGNFDFGPDGVITTGMPELDELVQAKLVELNLNPALMSGEQMLRTIYNNVTYHNSYLMATKDQLHEVGDISWVNDAAYRMLTLKKGCCYNFAAEFYWLAKAIGYDAIIYSGTVNPPPIQRAHGWVEIEFDGVPFIFDTELEYTQVREGNTGTSYFKISYERVQGWYYYRGEEDE